MVLCCILRIVSFIRNNFSGINFELRFHDDEKKVLENWLEQSLIFCHFGVSIPKWNGPQSFGLPKSSPWRSCGILQSLYFFNLSNEARQYSPSILLLKSQLIHHQNSEDPFPIYHRLKSSHTSTIIQYLSFNVHAIILSFCHFIIQLFIPQKKTINYIRNQNDLPRTFP